MSQLGGIYQIRCLVDDKVYIGSAKVFSKRWWNHKESLRGGTHVNPHLQRAFNKHGEENFVFEIVEVLGEYVKELYFTVENYYIKKSLSNSYNIAKAEGGWTYATFQRKEEIARKISESVKKNISLLSPLERREKFGVWKGLNHPESTKQKISQTMTGVLKSEETIKKMREAAQRRPLEKRQEAGNRVGKGNVGRQPSNARKVLVDDLEFDTLKLAAVHLNTCSSALCNAIKRNNKFKRHHVRYANC